MQNEARFEFVLIDGTGSSPGEGGAPQPNSFDETNRLLRRILEQQGFQRLGGDGANAPTMPAPSAESLADHTPPSQTAPTSSVTPVADRLGDTSSTTPPRIDPQPERRPAELPTPKLSEPAQRTVDPVRPTGSISRTVEPVKIGPSPPPAIPPSRSLDDREPSIPTANELPSRPPATTTPPTADVGESLEEVSRKFREETEEMGRKLRDELFGSRRRKRDAEAGIIQAELVATPPKPDPPPPREKPNSLEEFSQQFREETEEMGRKLREELFGSRRRKRTTEPTEAPASERLDAPPPAPSPPPPPAVPPRDTSIHIPKTIPLIGGAAIGATAAATTAGVAAGVIGVAAIAKANYELIQSVDKLAKNLAPELANYSPEVALATAQAELRRTMRSFSTSDRLGPDVARLVEANSRLNDALVQIRDVIAGPLMKDAATIKESFAGVAEVVSGFVERNQGAFDIAYEVMTKYLPFIPTKLIGDTVTAAELMKRMTGYESNQAGFEAVFMGDGFITPPGWGDANEVDANPVFADPGLPGLP